MTVAVVVPAPELSVRAVEAEPNAAVPMLRFAVELTDESGRDVYTIALTARIQIDADRRAYAPEARERLLDLFGEPERIPQTAGALPFAEVETLVPSFRDRVSFELRVPVSGDLELAAGRYFASLTDGAAPLTFNFSGSIFYSGDGDRLQVTPVPWSCSARFRLAVAVWRGLIDRRYAASGFVRLQADTLAALRARRAELGLPTLDATIAQALRDSK